jgi:hypothetical protein
VDDIKDLRPLPRLVNTQSCCYELVRANFNKLLEFYVSAEVAVVSLIHIVQKLCHFNVYTSPSDRPAWTGLHSQCTPGRIGTFFVHYQFQSIYICSRLSSRFGIVASGTGIYAWFLSIHMQGIRGIVLYYCSNTINFLTPHSLQSSSYPTPIPAVRSTIKRSHGQCSSVQSHCTLPRYILKA